MLLRNTHSIVFSPPSVEKADLRIKGDKIVDRGKHLAAQGSEKVLDLKGKLVAPGFVNAHTHLYSALARGMPAPKHTPKSFLEVLQKVWWRLDRALDDDSIYYSALVGAIDAALCGTTTLVDHHSSPKAIPGSLDIIKEALEEIGLRGVLCYEVTDRGGRKERNQGLEENERFIRYNIRDSKYRGMVGAHASFTLGNDSLELCSAIASQYGTGVHIHVAEDECDIADAEEKYSCNVTDRIEKYNILKKQSILAHCVHSNDFPRLRDAQCWLVHNPRSNMNNRVGHAPIHKFGKRAALGTDGFPADMIEEARIGFLKLQESRGTRSRNTPRKVRGNDRDRDPGSDNVDLTTFLQGGQKLVSEMFGQTFGTLRENSVADLIVIDYIPPTPLTRENLASHLLFGMNSSMVESVMVGGRWIVKNREVVGIDVPSAYEKASKVARKLWSRMGRI